MRKVKHCFIERLDDTILMKLAYCFNLVRTTQQESENENLGYSHGPTSLKQCFYCF